MTSDSDRGYRDLPEHIAALDEAGLLVRVDRPINKDTELHPLVRWQYRGGLADSARRAFLFTDVVDATGRSFDLPVVVGALAANRDVYRLAIGRDLDDIGVAWEHALRNPVEPVVVASGACHDLFVSGDEMDRGAPGLDALPVPISTPGWDNAPYTTTSQFITKDPETGLQNMGVYRGQIKGRRRLGVNPSVEGNPGIYAHWLQYRERGEPMPCAVVIGGPPAATFAAVQRMPQGVDELSIAGGLVGAPIRVVQAVTVDLLVPAEADIVIEGQVDTRWLEPEGPFGESHGHVNPQQYNAFMNVTAITRRQDAVLSSIISQVTPSESSVMKRAAYEPAFLLHLRERLGLASVLSVSLHERLVNVPTIVVVQFRRGTPEPQVWRALHGAASLHPSAGKLLIAVDEDIDPADTDSVLWAMAYRMRPHRDLEFLRHRDPGHGPQDRSREDSAVLVNATLREDFAPISLPKRIYMERAREIWQELGLPPLRERAPWHGYQLGKWEQRLEDEADLAVAGRFAEVGELAATRRRDDVPMNHPVELGTFDDGTGV